MPQDRDNRFVRACAAKMYWDMSHEPFLQEISGKMSQTKMGTTMDNRFLSKAAQAKCIWTSEKINFTPEFRIKMRQTKAMTDTLFKPAQSKWTWTCHRKKTGHQMEQTENAQASTPTFRTLQCGHIVWEMNLFMLGSEMDVVYHGIEVGRRLQVHQGAVWDGGA